jgi:uncharacterized protein
MRAVDTNLLVYARVAASPNHAAARQVLANLSEGSTLWAIPWPCIYEFLRVITHPRVYRPALPTTTALDDLQVLLASPSLVLLGETSHHAAILDKVVRDSGVSGNLVHDAHIVALCLEHGVRELLTADRDFARFAGLKITNPLAN